MNIFGLDARLIAAGLLGVLISQISPALAAIDLGPLVTNAIDATTVVLLGLAGWLSTYGVKFLASRVALQDTQIETLLAQRLNEALAYGINLAAAAARKKASEKGSLVIEIDNVFIEIVAKYAINAVPDTLQRFGWIGKDLLPTAQLQRAIITRAEQTLPAAVPPGAAIVTAPAVDLAHAEGAVRASTPFPATPL